VRNNQEALRQAGIPKNHKSNTVAPAAMPLPFVEKTEEVALPSKGLLYPEGHPLHGKETIEIKHLTANEEDILTNHTYSKLGTTELEFLKAVIKDDVDPSTLTLVDVSAIFLFARIFGYGNSYEPTVKCPNVDCGHKKKHEFDLYEYTHFGHIDTEEFPGVSIDEKTGVISFTLSNTGWKIKVRPMTLRDKMELDAEKKAKKKRKTSKYKKARRETPYINQLVKIVESIAFPDPEGGDNFIVATDKIHLREVIKVMPTKDTTELRKISNGLGGDIDLTFDFECEECDYEGVMEVPLDSSFFRP